MRLPFAQFKVPWFTFLAGTATLMITGATPTLGQDLANGGIEQTEPRIRQSDTNLRGGEAKEDRHLVVRADGVTFKSEPWPTTISICSSVSRIFESGVGRVPSLGRKTIVIRKAEDGVTRTDLRGLPKEYWVNLSSPDSLYCACIAFESSHEYTHIWINPRMTDNMFVESMCDAMGYIVLNEMSREWRNHPRRELASYAPEFSNYRNSLIATDLKDAGITSEDDVDRWILLNQPRLTRLREGNEDTIALRICSIGITRALKRHPNAWGALLHLGAAVQGEWVDFEKWRLVADPADRRLVQDLADTFAQQFASGDTMDGSPQALHLGSKSVRGDDAIWNGWTRSLNTWVAHAMTRSTRIRARRASHGDRPEGSRSRIGLVWTRSIQSIGAL